MSGNGFADMLRIVVSMLSRHESAVFREPVDWEGLGLLDYLDIVKRPMDLGTILKDIENQKYACVEDIADDVRLVWTNCMLYNRDGSEYYHLADKFSKGFEEAYAALRKKEDSRNDVNRVPSVEERIQLSYDIFKVDNTEMAKILTMIEAACPSAISRKVLADEILINFDGLTPSCFHEVNTYVQGCTLISMTNATKSGKKKKVAFNSTYNEAASGAQSEIKQPKKSKKH